MHNVHAGIRQPGARGRDVGGMYVGVREGGREEGERECGRRRSGALLGRALQRSCVVSHIAQVLVHKIR